MDIFFQFISRSIMQGTPLLYGATGEIITEKSGNLNLGIPGIMYVGAISGVIGAFLYQTNTNNFNEFLAVLIPFFASIIGSLLVTLIYCFLTITLRANQNVTGLAITTFGVGFGNFFGGSLIKVLKSEVPYLALGETATAFKKALPFAADMNSFGKMFFSYGFMVYLSIIIALITSFILKRTRLGLQLRAVGESPATADAAGINVNGYKYVATLVGGVIAGLGGLYYVMDYSNGIWASNLIGDRGWLAIAIVIFAIWKPDLAIISSYLFGALYILFARISVPMTYIPLIQMLPYVVTILVLVIVSARKKKEHLPPEALGLSYFREER